MKVKWASTIYISAKLILKLTSRLAVSVMSEVDVDSQQKTANVSSSQQTLVAVRSFVLPTQT